MPTCSLSAEALKTSRLPKRCSRNLSPRAIESVLHCMLGWRGGGWRESREDLGRRAPEVANDRASKNQAPYLEILLIARIALIWDWLFGLRQCWLLGSWVTPFRHDSCLDRI